MQIRKSEVREFRGGFLELLQNKICKLENVRRQTSCVSLQYFKIKICKLENVRSCNSAGGFLELIKINDAN